jgi:hypothetical protein
MFTKITQAVDQFLRSIVAEEVAKVEASLKKAQLDTASVISNDVKASLKVLEAFQVEALRVLTTLEQATPSNIAEKNRLFVEVRSQVTEIANKFEQLHPSSK